MSRVNELGNKSFWNRLYALSKLPEPKTILKLAMEFGVSVDQLKFEIEEAADLGLELKFEEIGTDTWVIPAQVDNKMTGINLSAFEWAHLNQFIDIALKKDEFSEFHSILSNVKSQSETLTEFDNLTAFNKMPLELHSPKDEALQYLEEAMLTKSLVQIQLPESKKKTIYPIKVIHLEGELSLVGEDSVDHCLFVMNLSEMQKVKVLAQSYHPQVTPFELEEFVSAIRNMNEKETRLILKIHDPESVNLFPNYHFLGKPCMITNPSGDLIWAAYVEPCADLYEWLIELGGRVEILDPVQFKSEYLGYCEEKLSKIA